MRAPGSASAISLAGFAARTQTAGLTGRDYAYNFDSQYDDGKHRANFEWGVTGEDFNPEVGFLENEDGYRRYRVGFEETMRQEKIRSWGFRELLPHANYTRYDYLDGGLNSAELHVDNHWDWENGNFITVGLNGTWDGLRAPFEVYPGIVVPAGEHGGLRMTLPGQHRSTQMDLWAGPVGPGQVPQRDPDQPDRSRSSCATADASRSIRRGTTVPSNCRRARSTPTSGTCA